MTRNASGNTFQVQTRLQELLANVVVDFDADDDDDEDKEKGGSGGAGDGGEGGEGGQGSGGTDDSIKDPDKKRLSDEAAKYRKERNDAKKELEAAQTRLRELDDASKSELEKAQRDLTEATAKLEAIESRDTVKARKLAFYESGAAGLFKNPKHALQLLDLSDLELNDDGEYDETAVKKKADALLKESPYLGADGESDDGGSGTGSGASGGEPRNPRRKREQEARDAVLSKKFPALSSRVQT
jgi:hypothetical protein